MPQTQREIQAILAAAGIRPLKRFGQHFLIDGNLMRKLVGAAQVTPRDVVLEVGPGTGSLTEELVKASGHVVAVEIDKTLYAICRDRFGPAANVTLIRGDVLERKTSLAQEVQGALRDWQRKLKGRMLLVANLPYQVATPLVIDLLLSDLDVTRLCFTVQAEVADRLVARCGGKAFGPISVFAQALARLERIAPAPPTAFWPVPKVHSAMLRVDVRPEAALPILVQQRLTALVHGCFNHRRKTMKSNLRTLLDGMTLERVEADGRWDLSLRPECITVDQWVALARLLVDGQ